MTDRMTADEFRTLQPRQGATKRVLAGKKAQATGKAFEKRLDRAHDFYASREAACIFRLPENTSPMPPTWLRDRKHTGIARMLTTPGPFDYFGCLGRGVTPEAGRMVAIEAKRTNERKTSLPVSPKAGLRVHQLEASADVARRFNAVALIVWLNGDERGVLMPDEVIAAEKRHRTGERKSIPWELFTPYRVGNGGVDGPIEDWLTPVLEWMYARRTEALA